ncbi:hypothetical protein [Parashewanella tropica]|uniref:hypothetical protein n=1 Tax=Parashewanella tropica TaxID=2547970 RepID=UPI00105A9071|nr:hypothetical protein [Parashewanella tropica]
MAIEVVWSVNRHQFVTLRELASIAASKKDVNVKVNITKKRVLLHSETVALTYNRANGHWVVTMPDVTNRNREMSKVCAALVDFLHDDTVQGFEILESDGSEQLAVSFKAKSSQLCPDDAATSFFAPMNAKPLQGDIGKVTPPKKMRSHFDTPQALIKNINELLEKTYNEQEHLDCYTKASETLLSDEWGIILERDTDGSFKEICLDITICRTLKALIARIVENKYSEFLRISNKRNATYGDMRDWIGDTVSEHEHFYSNAHILPYLAQVASWSFILRRSIFPFLPHQSPDVFRAEVFGLFYELVPIEFTQDKQPRRYCKPERFKRSTIRVASGKQRSGVSKNNSCGWRLGPSHLDEIELNLYLLGKRPIANLTIPLSGRQITVQKQPQGNIEKVDRPSSQTEALRLSKEGKVSPRFIENQQLVLPARDDYQAVLTVLFPESGHLYILPKLLGEGEAVFIKKLDVLLANETSKTMNIVFFSIQQGSLSLLSNLNLRFAEHTQFNIITPFRQLSKNADIRPKNGKWPFQQYSLMAGDLTEVHGHLGFTFYEREQQFHFTLKDNSERSSTQTECVITPYTWLQESVKVPSDSFMLIATAFTQSLKHRMICPLTLVDVTEIENPCLDTSGHVFEKSELLRVVREKGINPLTRKSMAEEDIIDSGPIIALFRDLKAALIFDGVDHVPVGDPITDMLLRQQQDTLERDGDRLTQLSTGRKNSDALVDTASASATATSSSEEDDLDLIKKQNKELSEET